MKEEMISCAGTSAGSFNNVKIYLGLMTKILKLTNKKCQEMRGVDQGIHNYILYGLKLELKKYPREIQDLYREFKWKPYSNQISPVYHMGVIPKEQISYNRSIAKFLRPGNEIPSIAHQIDLDIIIFSHLLNYYRKLKI